LGVSACGGGPGEGAIANVRGHAITRAALMRQISAIAPNHVAPNPPRYAACIRRRAAFTSESIGSVLKLECEQEYESLKARALGSLIYSRWLLGEAADRRLPAVDGSARRAASEIAEALTKNEPKIDRARIAAYYRRHIESFTRAERRDYEIVESLYTERAARSAIREARRGRRPATLWLHESLASTTTLKDKKQTRGTVQAIFAARAHVLTGPVLSDGRYWVFEVTRITPAAREPLAKVAHSIEARLAGEQRTRALVRFRAAWESKWRSVTRCQPAYVVQNCSEYHGTRTAEGPFAGA
jgi:foldase protein PrsA